MRLFIRLSRSFGGLHGPSIRKLQGDRASTPSSAVEDPGVWDFAGTRYESEEQVKAVRVANLQAVAFTELVTIVRGDTAFSLRKSEVADLIAVLRELGADTDTPTAIPQTVSAPIATATAVSPMDDSEPATPKRRKGVWTEVRAFLRSCQRAQGRASIVRHVRRARVLDGDVESAIDRVLERRVASGDLIGTKSGRYRLARL